MSAELHAAVAPTVDDIAARLANGLVIPQPLGVVALIVAWNFPIYLAFSQLVVVLAAGNRTTVKTRTWRDGGLGSWPCYARAARSAIATPISTASVNAMDKRRSTTSAARMLRIAVQAPCRATAAACSIRLLCPRRRAVAADVRSLMVRISHSAGSSTSPAGISGTCGRPAWRQMTTAISATSTAAASGHTLPGKPGSVHAMPAAGASQNGSSSTSATEAIHAHHVDAPAAGLWPSRAILTSTRKRAIISAVATDVSGSNSRVA